MNSDFDRFLAKGDVFDAAHKTDLRKSETQLIWKNEAWAHNSVVKPSKINFTNTAKSADIHRACFAIYRHFRPRIISQNLQQMPVSIIQSVCPRLA